MWKEKGGNSGGQSARYLLRIVVFLIALLIGCLVFYADLARLFQANPPLNGIILGLLGWGLADVLWQLIQLVREDRYLDQIHRCLAYVDQDLESPERANEVILGGDQHSLTEFMQVLHQVIMQGHHHATFPYLLDSLGERGESRRTLPRYLAGILIVLGLLGTFWGLLQTVQGVQGVIGTLSGDQYKDVAAFISDLQIRMTEPINGMALAFSTSLFGLGASLILGFTETQLGRAVAHGQTRVEEIIITGLLPFWRAQRRPANLDLEAEDRPAYTAALLEGISQRLDNLIEQMDHMLTRQSEPEGVSRTVTRVSEELRHELQELGDRFNRLEEQRTRSVREGLDRLARVLARDRDSGDA